MTAAVVLEPRRSARAPMEARRPGQVSGSHDSWATPLTTTQKAPVRVEPSHLGHTPTVIVERAASPLRFASAPIVRDSVAKVAVGSTMPSQHLHEAPSTARAVPPVVMHRVPAKEVIGSSLSVAPLLSERGELDASTLSKSEILALMENERSFVTTIVQNILATQVNSLKEIIESEVQDMNLRIQGNAGIFQANLNTLSSSCEERLQAVEESLGHLAHNGTTNATGDSDVTALVERISRFTDACESRVSKLEASSAECEKKLAGLESFVDELQGQAAVFSSNDEALQLQVDDLQRQVYDARGEAAMHAATGGNAFDVQEKRFESLYKKVTEIEAKDTANQSLEERLQGVEAQIQGLPGSYDLKGEIAEMAQRIDDVDTRSKVLSSKLLQDSAGMAERQSADDLQSLGEQVHQMSGKLEEEHQRRCLTVIDLEARWVRRIEEVRIEMQREREEAQTAESLVKVLKADYETKFSDQRIEELVKVYNTKSPFIEELQNEKNERVREISDLRTDFKRDIEAERSDRVRMSNTLEANLTRSLQNFREELHTGSASQRSSEQDELFTGSATST